MTTGTARYIKLNYAGKPLKESAKKFAMVHDRKLGLIWTAIDASTVYQTPAALAKLAKECRVGGFDDWDMPECLEYENSILDLTQHSPASNRTFFGNMRSDCYISKTPAAWRKSSGNVWGVYFGYGYVYTIFAYHDGFGRFVRRVSPSQ